MLKLKNIHKSFGQGQHQLAVLNGLDFTVKEGEFVCILGSSGCGKSTLLNIVGLLDHFDTGSYQLENIDVTTLRETQRAKLRNRNFGFIFQSFHLLPELNVWQNITVPMGYAGCKQGERQARADELLEQFELTALRNKSVWSLSGGERQRIAIMRALANKPRILLADEPTGNLDEVNTQAVISILDTLHSQGITILMVTHDKSLTDVADRVVQIADGRIVPHTPIH